MPRIGYYIAMSDTVNPYQSPETAIIPEQSLGSSERLTETMLLQLKGASPWMKFIGIVGFIGAGIAALTGLSSISLIPMMKMLGDEIPDLEVFESLGWVFGVGALAYCLICAALVFFPSLFIFRFGDKISNYLRIGAERELELAFQNNKYYWKFIGILTIISLASVPLMIIGFIIAAVALAMAAG